jgi:hypothetical protein
MGGLDKMFSRTRPDQNRNVAAWSGLTQLHESRRRKRIVRAVEGFLSISRPISRIRDQGHPILSHPE